MRSGLILITHPYFSQRKVVFLLAGFCCLLWGSAYPAIKSGYALFAIATGDVSSKMVFAGYRFVLAGFFLLLMAKLVQRQRLTLTQKNLQQVVTLGLAQTSLQYVFFYIGLAYTTGVKGSIMNGTGTFFSVILAHFIFQNDRLSWRKMLGCGVGFAGVMMVNFNPDVLDFHFTLLGEGFVVLAAFVLAAASIYGKQVSQRMDSILMTGYQLGIGGLVLAAGGHAFGGTLAGLSWQSVALLLYLALLSSVAFALWTILLKFNSVGSVAVFNFLIPVFGALLSALFLGESILEWKNVGALALVCAGIVLVTRETSRSVSKLS